MWMAPRCLLLDTLSGTRAERNVAGRICLILGARRPEGDPVQMTASESTPPASSDPRAVRSRAAILEAAGAMLVEGGPAALTIEGVAERSGVAKTTIYRHWPSRSKLILDAFDSLFQSRRRTPPRGPIRDQLTTLINGVVRGITSSRWAPAMSGLFAAADRDPELMLLVHDFLRVRMEPTRIALHGAIERGEILPTVDVDASVSMLVGPIFYRRIVSREKLDAEFVDQVVTQFLRAVAMPGTDGSDRDDAAAPVGLKHMVHA